MLDFLLPLHEFFSQNVEHFVRVTTHGPPMIHLFARLTDYPVLLSKVATEWMIVYIFLLWFILIKGEGMRNVITSKHPICLKVPQWTPKVNFERISLWISTDSSGLTCWGCINHLPSKTEINHKSKCWKYSKMLFWIANNILS